MRSILLKVFYYRLGCNANQYQVYWLYCILCGVAFINSAELIGVDLMRCKAIGHNVHGLVFEAFKRDPRASSLVGLISSCSS
jgi:hypothetical protein